MFIQCLQVQNVAIMRRIRLPRMLAGLLAGIGLSVSGSLLQNVTDNGMASPNIIGVNAGAGFVMILMLYAVPMAGNWLAVGAFLGAFATTLLIVWTANRMGTSKVTIVLAGLVFTTLLNAGISFMSLLDTDVLARICTVLNCQISDLLEFVPPEKK